MIGCPFPLSLRRTKASLAVDRLQQGEPSLFGSSSAQLIMWYPPDFGSHWGYHVYSSTPWEQEKKAIFGYTLVISFLPRLLNTHRVP